MRETLNLNPAELDACVHCGFCLPTCPTYALWGEEMDSPRGRIYLMNMLNEGQADLNATTVRHFDTCLGCMACVTACPSGVRYDHLIEQTRAQVAARFPRPLPERALRRMIFELFPHPDRLTRALWPLRLYQRSGAQRLARRTGATQALPQTLQALESLAPQLRAKQAEPTPEYTPAQGAPRGRVGLLLGCVQRVFFGDVNAATARVLAAEGYDVIAPRWQGCCGALAVHAGESDRAQTDARRMIDAFAGVDVEAIIINAAGCGSTMKDYGRLLADDPAYADRAAAFAAQCLDISEFLAGIAPRAPRHPLPLVVAYHDACHLQHAQGVRAQPRQALHAIPDLQLREIPDAAICCGSAGIYNLVEPEPARELGDRKAANILQTGAQAVVTSNPGCLLQLTSALARAGQPLPLLHFAQIIDASLRGASVADLLG